MSEGSGSHGPPCRDRRRARIPATCSPEGVGDRRVGSPSSRSALRATQPWVPVDPTVVDRISQGPVDGAFGHLELVRQLLDRHRTGCVPVEEGDCPANGVWVDLQYPCLSSSPEPQPGVTAWITDPLELRRVAIRDPIPETPAVPLALVRLADHLIPIPGIRRHEAAVAHHPGDSRGMQDVLDKFQGASQVALPAVGVAS